MEKNLMVFKYISNPFTWSRDDLSLGIKMKSINPVLRVSYPKDWSYTSCISSDSLSNCSTVSV